MIITETIYLPSFLQSDYALLVLDDMKETVSLIAHQKIFYVRSKLHQMNILDKPTA